MPACMTHRTADPFAKEFEGNKFNARAVRSFKYLERRAMRLQELIKQLKSGEALKTKSIDVNLSPQGVQGPMGPPGIFLIFLASLFLPSFLPLFCEQALEMLKPFFCLAVALQRECGVSEYTAVRKSSFACRTRRTTWSQGIARRPRRAVSYHPSATQCVHVAAFGLHCVCYRIMHWA